MMAPSALLNLDNVRHQFSMAKKQCVKLSGLSFVLFHPKNGNEQSTEEEEIE